MTAPIETDEKWELPKNPNQINEWFSSFSIESPEQLSWALRQIQIMKGKIGDIEAAYNLEIDRLEMAMNTATASLDILQHELTTKVHEYALMAREESKGEVKSLSTPYGTVITRTNPGSWQVTEEGIAVLSALYPHLVKRTPKLNEIKKAFSVGDDGQVLTETGLPVQGITVSEPELSVSIKF